MKKKFKLFLLFCLLVPCTLHICGCEGQEDSDLATITGVSFNNLTVDYDGNEHELLIEGELPEGASVSYQNNKGTNAGTYNAEALIEKEGYKTLKLNATLTINKLSFSDITFENKSFTYDGTEKKILVAGDIPNFANVTYENNKGTDAGEYKAKVTISAENYNTKTLEAKLVINKIDIPGITFNDASYNYDGNEHSILITGTLPDGVNVTYTNNKFTDAGSYTATATLSGKNYNTVTLQANLRIKPNLTQLANTVLTNVLKVPDVWEFLPESFELENKVTSENINLDYTNFVNVSSLPTKGLGKQMNVVYSTLLDTENALSYLRYIYGSFNAIESLYQTYLNTNPENYAVYEKTTENFTFKVELVGKDYSMIISYKGVSLELSYEKDTQKCYGKIKLTDSNVIKYEMADDELTIGYSILGVALTKLHFERDEDDNVSGYLIEYYGTETKNIKTSAIIKVDEDYTSIISNKRETDDLVIEGYMEVYDNETGNLVASEVKETVKLANYDTKWFNLRDITGINTIKVLDDINGLNADSIYINDSANLIKTKTVGGFSTKTASRRFDIEMKEMYFYTYNSEEEKYEKKKVSIPMLFVQNEQLDTFSTDFYNANKNNGAVSNTSISIDSDANTYFSNEFANIVEEFKSLKETMTYAEIKNYIAE